MFTLLLLLLCLIGPFLCSLKWTSGFVELPYTLFGTFSAIYNNNLYIFGGIGHCYQGAYTWCDKIYYMNINTLQWNELGFTLDETVFTQQSTVIIDNLIYLIGPELYHSSKFDSIIYVFNATSNQLLTPIQMGIAYNLPCAVTNTTHIFVIGGQSYDSGWNFYSTIQIYDIAQASWDIYNQPDVPIQLSSSACVLIEDLIYIFGGMNSTSALNTIFTYNIVTNKITQLNMTLKYPTYGSKAIHIPSENGIYIIGGGSSDNNVYDYVQKYDLIYNEIILDDEMLDRRYSPIVNIINDKLYVIGGEDGCTGTGCQLSNSEMTVQQFTTVSPTNSPTKNPTISPSVSTNNPTNYPTLSPTETPSHSPSKSPTFSPTKSPSITTLNPTFSPTKSPSITTLIPTKHTENPTQNTINPTQLPTTSHNHSNGIKLVPLLLIIIGILTLIIVLLVIFILYSRKQNKGYICCGDAEDKNDANANALENDALITSDGSIIKSDTTTKGSKLLQN